MPYWRIKSTMRPDEIIFIQILPSVSNAVPIYSSLFIVIIIIIRSNYNNNNNNIRVTIQITMQLCHTCFKMIVYDSNVL